MALERKINLYRLGFLPGQQSMLAYHALAALKREALVFVSPETPLVSVGFFQEAKEGIDLEYCSQHKISVMRRATGGGNVYLDRNQIFFQIILRRDHPLVPLNVCDLYRLFYGPAIRMYQRFGIDARYKEINDIVTAEGRKITGATGGDIGDYIVMGAGVLLDFDTHAMSRILKVPEEKFRDKLYKTLEENLTTMRKELGRRPNREDVVDVLVEEFRALLGDMEEVPMDRAFEEKMGSLESEMMCEEFLLKKGKNRPAQVKIIEGVHLGRGSFKAKGGLIQVTLEVRDDRIQGIFISGDFACIPAEKLEDLEKALVGLPAERAALKETVESFCSEHGVQMPGISPEDLATPILEAAQRPA